MEELITLIRSAPSTVTALSAWLDVETLELDQVLSDTRHQLSEHEHNVMLPHPGVLHGYHRTALLRTPMPSRRVVASVSATVLLDRLPASTARDVLLERRTLGSILLDVGARREFLAVSRGGRSDAAGNPIAFRTSFTFVSNDHVVALVREDVYESIITRKALT